MQAEFYDREVEEDVFGQVDPVKKTVLYFKLIKPSIADKSEKAVPFEFDGPATEEHKKGYGPAYAEYLKSKESKEVIVSEMEDASTPSLVSSDSLPKVE